MLAALLLNLGTATADSFASPGDYRLEVMRKRKRKPIEVVEQALKIAPETVQPFMADGAAQSAAELVNFSKLLADTAAYEAMVALVNRREEEEVATLLMLMD